MKNIDITREDNEQIKKANISRIVIEYSFEDEGGNQLGTGGNVVEFEPNNDDNFDLQIKNKIEE